MKTRSFQLLTLCLVSLGGLPFSDAGEKKTSSPYPILDSGVWAEAVGMPDIYWIDNHSVIFRGSEEKEKAKRPEGRFNVAIWKIDDGVSVHAKGVRRIQGLLGRLCYRDGVVFYPLRETDTLGNEQYMYGKLGTEKVFTTPKGSNTVLDEMNCRLTDVESVRRKQGGRAIRPLLERHGVLDLGAINLQPSQRGPVKLYRHDGKEVEIPLKPQHVESIRYYQFKDAYAIYGHNAGNRFWWLYSDGRVEEVPIPVNEVPYATRKGLVVKWGKATTNKDAGTSGLYLWPGSNPIKLITGYVNGVVVSPDGCKLAFVHAPYPDAIKVSDPGPITLKAITLCMEEKTNGK